LKSASRALAERRAIFLLEKPRHHAFRRGLEPKNAACFSYPLIRRTENNGLPELTIEVYGIPGSAISVPLMPILEGEHFLFDNDDIYIDGDLLSYNGDNAQIRINSALYNQFPLCFSGTHTLQKAE
jgi:hypothetical protein